MHYVLAIQTANAVLRIAKRHGATIPKPIAAEHAKLAELLEKARSLALNTASDFPQAVAASLEAGNDPATDPDVQAALTRRAIVDSQNAVSAAIGDRVTAFIMDNGATILKAFTEPFDAAAEKIHRAVDLLGDIDIDDGGAVVKLGPAAASAWAEAKAAERVITDTMSIRASLAGAASELTVNPQYRLLAIADVPPGQFLDDGLHNQHVSPWEAARRGYPLSLAMPDVLKERIAAALAEMERRNTKADNAFRDEYRRTHGVSVA